MEEKSLFNKDNKTRNSAKASVFGLTNQLLKIVLEFGYRTVFLLILSKEYLGLNGLFTNVLNILSIAELGIGTIIAFRLYSPISANDVECVGRFMNFYKNIYRLIAIVIAICGCAIMPFIKFFVKDISEVPADVNIYIIYALFLFKSVSSYFFVYKQSLLSADQRNDAVSKFTILLNIVRYGVEIVALFSSKNYTLVLFFGIMAQVLMNFIIALVVTKMYKPVFLVKNSVTKAEKMLVLKDAGAMMCHKISGAVVLATDSILLSIFAGLSVSGIYSNYSMILIAVSGLVSQLLGSFVSSIGKLRTEGDIENERKVYYKLQFANMWIAGFCVIAYVCLLNPFITVWQDESFLFDMKTVVVLCASQFLLMVRSINGNFVNACGLFNRDKIRPLIEAAINLVSSIIFVKLLGVVGIFLGTVLSSMLTIFWREPYLLHKYELKCSQKKYWAMYGFCVLATLGAGSLTYWIVSLLPVTLGYLILMFVIVAIVPNVIFAVLTCWTKEFKFYFNFAINIVKRVVHHRKPECKAVEKEDNSNNENIVQK